MSDIITALVSVLSLLNKPKIRTVYLLAILPGFYNSKNHIEYNLEMFIWKSGRGVDPHLNVIKHMVFGKLLKNNIIYWKHI